LLLLLLLLLLLFYYYYFFAISIRLLFVHFCYVALLWILPSSGLLRGVKWFRLDVSGIRIGPIYKGQAAASWTACPLKRVATDSPETSVSNHLSPRNSPEDGRIKFPCGRSLRFFCWFSNLLYVFCVSTLITKIAVFVMN
jgi:hypothetical protein